MDKKLAKNGASKGKSTDDSQLKKISESKKKLESKQKIGQNGGNSQMKKISESKKTLESKQKIAQNGGKVAPQNDAVQNDAPQNGAPLIRRLPQGAPDEGPPGPAGKVDERGRNNYFGRFRKSPPPKEEDDYIDYRNIPIELPKYVEPLPKEIEEVEKKTPKKATTNEQNCYDITGEAFTTVIEDTTDYNWCEIFCFPYMMCLRFWNFFISMCGGSQQCLIFWMVIQWLVCKITKMTTPNPIIYPYYFYVFFQVFGMAVLVYYAWKLLAPGLLLPYFRAHLHAALGGKYDSSNKFGAEKPGKIFRKYCFRKAELFDTSLDVTNFATTPYDVGYKFLALSVVDIFFYEVLRP